MDFRSKSTRRIVNLSTFLLHGLKAEQSDFFGGGGGGGVELALALEPFKKLIHPCPSVKRNSSELKILQKCSKYYF